MGGVWFFLLLLADAARQVAAQVMMERGRLFWDIKNLSFCSFLVAIKFLSHFIGECHCKYAACSKMK